MFSKTILPVVMLAALLLNGCSFSGGWRTGYNIEKGKILYYSGFPATGHVLEGADPKSFEIIDNNYAKDKMHVYCRSEIINGANPATFEWLGGAFSKDKSNGYYDTETISNDGPNFKIVPNPENQPGIVSANGVMYARDRQKVYSGDRVLDSADAATFAFLPMFNGNYLTYDRTNVYIHDRPLQGADGASFKRETEFHFKDKNAIWVLSLGRETKWIKMTDADLATFTGLKRFYAKDKSHVYYEDGIVEGADIASFEETENHQAKDKNGSYQSGRLVKK
ncbi:MAG: DKNYY domain-containing protein [Bacteroidota bacterium]